MAQALGLLILFSTAGGLLLAAVVASIAIAAVRPRRETDAWAIARGLPVEPSDLGLESETWRLRRPDGAELVAWTIATPSPSVRPGEPPAPRIPLLVLAHGWYRGRRSMLGRLGPLLAHAERIVLVDARGHGESGGRSSLGAREAADLLAVAEAAGAGPGRRAVLGGWSLGGTAALAAAGDPAARDVVAGVLAVAPVVDLGSAVAARMRQFEAAPWLLLPPVRLVLRLLGAWPDPPDPAAIRCPVLVVHGEDDRICPIAGVRTFAAGLPHGRLLAVAGAGHDEPERHEPEAFAAAVGELVGRAVAAPAESC